MAERRKSFALLLLSTSTEASLGHTKEAYAIWGSGNQIQVYGMSAQKCVHTHACVHTHEKPSETWLCLFVAPCHCDLYVPSENLPWVPRGILHPSAHHMSLEMSHKNYTNEDDTTICAWGICQDPSLSPTPKPHHRLFFGLTFYSFPLRWQLSLSPSGCHSPSAHAMPS